jgi:hypothetical protein
MPDGQKFLRLFSKRRAFFLSMRLPQGSLVLNRTGASLARIGVLAHALRSRR